LFIEIGIQKMIASTDFCLSAISACIGFIGFNEYCKLTNLKNDMTIDRILLGDGLIIGERIIGDDVAGMDVDGPVVWILSSDTLRSGNETSLIGLTMIFSLGNV
jgi:hypothetical protein